MSDRLGGKALVYFGLYDAREVPGVARKVDGVLAAARAIGFATRTWAEPFIGTAPIGRLAAAIDAAQETHLILRSIGFANLFLMPALIRARRRGMHVVIDVPSPNRVAMREIWSSRQSLWRRARGVVAFAISGPWALWPASRIVQYAPEGMWFRLGNAGRSVEIGNGIDAAAIEPRRIAPAWPSATLKVLAVASVARWHGLDRLLRAMGEFHRRDGRAFDVHLTIAGDGPELGSVRQLTESIGLSQKVTFAGNVTGPALMELYESSHLAVSSLGLHRIGLRRASVLKAREYCAVGIPFIASGDDPDFNESVPYRLTVPGDETTSPLTEIFSSFDTLQRRFDDRQQRLFASARLDWRHKLHAFGLRPS
jgi:glycosyltransferase involved in cell wall biosynthesis